MTAKTPTLKELGCDYNGERLLYSIDFGLRRYDVMDQAVDVEALVSEVSAMIRNKFGASITGKRHAAEIGMYTWRGCGPVETNVPQGPIFDAVGKQNPWYGSRDNTADLVEAVKRGLETDKPGAYELGRREAGAFAEETKRLLEIKACMSPMKVTRKPVCTCDAQQVVNCGCPSARGLPCPDKRWVP